MADHKIAYLAGPVRKISRPAATQWRSVVSNSLATRGIVAFSPPGAWITPFNPDFTPMTGACLEAKIKLVNDYALSFSDVLIVAYHMIESEGTDDEIVNAINRGIPIVVYQLRWKGFEEWADARGLIHCPTFDIHDHELMADHICKLLDVGPIVEL